MSKLKDDRTNTAKAETLVTNGGFRKEITELHWEKHAC